MAARIIFSILMALSTEAQAPWIGIWKLDPARSTAASYRYKRVMTKIEPSRDGLKVTYEMVGVRGGVSHLEWTGKLDGRDYPVEGADYVLTNAYTLIGDRSYRIVVKAEGSAVASAVVEVSADGKTLTSTTTERNARGESVTTLNVYEKQ
jgi:hypothetical protein